MPVGVTKCFSCLFDSAVKVAYCLDVEFVNVVPNICACFVGCIIFCLESVSTKLLYMFRVGLQVLNSFILTESSGLFSNLDYKRAADTRYLTSHSGGSWFTP